MEGTESCGGVQVVELARGKRKIGAWKGCWVKKKFRTRDAQQAQGKVVRHGLGKAPHADSVTHELCKHHLKKRASYRYKGD